MCSLLPEKHLLNTELLWTMSWLTTCDNFCIRKYSSKTAFKWTWFPTPSYLCPTSVPLFSSQDVMPLAFSDAPRFSCKALVYLLCNLAPSLTHSQCPRRNNVRLSKDSSQPSTTFTVSTTTVHPRGHLTFSIYTCPCLPFHNRSLRSTFKPRSKVKIFPLLTARPLYGDLISSSVKLDNPSKIAVHIKMLWRK